MSTLSRIPAMAPIDRKTARTTGRGTTWEPAKPYLDSKQVRSENPLPTRPFPGGEQHRDNLAGRKVDRLTVVGLAAGLGKSKRGSRWVVRCTCGAFEHRTTTFLKSEVAQARARCTRCDYQDEMINGRKP